MMRKLCAEAERFDRGLGEERDLVDFFEVVVLGSTPEDGDVFDSCRRSRLLGAGYGGSGFEQGEQRASEQTDLLAGDDGSRASAKLGDVGESGGAGAKGKALMFESVGKCGGVGGWSGWLHPGAAEGLGSEPVAHS